jgi:hypothetical protein
MMGAPESGAVGTPEGGKRPASSAAPLIDPLLLEDAPVRFQQYEQLLDEFCILGDSGSITEWPSVSGFGEPFLPIAIPFLK